MRSGVICGTILIVVLVVVAGFFLLKGPTCALQTEKPQPTIESPFRARYDTVKLAFVGYLVNQKNEYLPIELKSIYADSKNPDVLVSLNFDCAQMNVTVTKDKEKFKVTKIVAASDPEQLSGEQIKCETDQFGVDLSGNVVTPINIKGEKTIECKTQGTKIVFDAFYLDAFNG